MNRAGWLFLACVVVSASVGADVVHFKDGDTKEGKVVAREKGVVVLEVTAGSLSANLRIPEQDILRVEEKPAPLEAFRQKEAAIRKDDPQAYYQLGLWAEENHLADQAKAAFEEALRLNPKDDRAARKLDFVQVGGQWLSKDSALSLLEDKYKNREFQFVYGTVAVLKDTPDEALWLEPGVVRTRVMTLYARTCERLSKWTEAEQAWKRARRFAANTTDEAMAAARIQILEKHPDGRFSCREEDIPASMVKFDAEAAEQVKKRRGESLADESVMTLAAKMYAFKMLDEARRLAEQALARDDDKAWQDAAADARTADQVLAGVAKDVRLTVLQARLQYRQGVLERLSKKLDEKVPGRLPARFDGTLQQAQECLDESRKLAAEYAKTIDYLSGLEDHLPQVIANFKELLAQERRRGDWLEGQVEYLRIKDYCLRQEFSYMKEMNSAAAYDPRRQTYPRGPGDAYFADGGQQWRQHASASVSHARKAYSILENMLQQYEKKPDLFSEEIAKTRQRLLESDALAKGVTALGDRRGATAQGWYPW